MRFKLDENMPVSLVRTLNQAGYDVETVYSESIAGIADDTLLDVCQSEQRILMTLDLDFANVVDYPPGTYAGIVVFRLKETGATATAVGVRRWLLAVRNARMQPGSLWIVDDYRIRIRMPSHDLGGE
ncbi:MAG: DUF5615 family PIN-like protein [Firmicutes bacterium]|jgi:predicted nuclease of predicted toxin-antitoxin system|nr:DUF5615 family PIN-like protein [Bacillota bacterium]MCL5015227.1 DUF5615 family PIN-like protein [Bacillota bacterium]HBQ95812.1 hypothetical protein [Sulfobacillus sp.]